MTNLLLLNNSKYFYYDEENLCMSEAFQQGNNSLNKIYCIGTPLYKESAVESIFEDILKDLFKKKLDYNDLKGNFLILLVKEKTIKILCDKTYQHHLFYDYHTKMLSTSFLELVKLRHKNLELNFYGFYEKISIGFHLGEDTLFKDIIRVSSENAHKVDALDIEYLTDHTLPKLDQIQFHSNGRKESLRQQEKRLNQYFLSIDKAFSKQKGDLGLSGGFDCRLVLALAQKNIRQPLHLHTHSTTGVHEEQSQIADKLAEYYGVNLTRISTTSPSKLDNTSFNQMLNDNLEFFDGRSARHLGAYSQTYTESYKRDSMGTADYSLNGLGGEIYRDSYFTGLKKMGWDEWAQRYLFLAGTKAVIPPSELKKISVHVKEILEKKLNWKKNYYDILFTQAYYGLIKMPLCNGSVVSGYNKVSPFLLPFVEYDNVIEALKAIPYFSIGGQYQSSLITSISPQLASYPSSYGGNFKFLGFSYYFWSLLKTVSSTKRRDAIVLKKMTVKAESLSSQKEYIRLNQFDIFKESIRVFKDIDGSINLNIALIESTNKRNIILLAYFLNKYL